MGELTPLVGEIVHYTNLGSVDEEKNMVYPPTQQAALVTGAKENNMAVSLLVFYEGGGMFPMSDVPFSKEYKRGCWTWIPLP
jgi:hypothetical protein